MEAMEVRRVTAKLLAISLTARCLSAPPVVHAPVTAGGCFTLFDAALSMRCGWLLFDDARDFLEFLLFDAALSMRCACVLFDDARDFLDCS
jgi:hypothetical protein